MYVQYSPTAGPTNKGGATNMKVGGQCIGRWGVNIVKTQKFEKGGSCTPPAPMVVPPLPTSNALARPYIMFQTTEYLSFPATPVEVTWNYRGIY